MIHADLITFGKYKDLSLKNLLKDRKYCEWLLKQDWFEKQYEYLYNRVKEYSPQKFFFSEDYVEKKNCDFIERYKYFHLSPVKDVRVKLSEDEKMCYEFYYSMIQKFKNQILDNTDENRYNIKAPSSWLKTFESKYNIGRGKLKDFLAEYELPNLPYIIENIKEEGGLEYKGAKSFLIAKKKSLSQEQFWEKLLKEKYGENIGSQYKYKNCFFDFICIRSNTLYECKLGIKDFNEDQYNKYLLTLDKYNLIYLIGTDCVINMSEKTLYTTDVEKYQDRLLCNPSPTKFETFLLDYNIKEIENVYNGL